MSEKKYNYVRRTVYWEGKQYSVRGKTPEEAAEKLGELKAKLKRGEVGISENMTVARWADEWLDTYKQGNMTAKSLQTYIDKINGYILPAVGTMRLKDVKDIHLQKILNSQTGMSFSHVSKLRMVMSQMFSQARRSRLILFDPAESLALPANEKRRRRSVTPEERRAILEVAEAHRFGLPILTILYCGLRPGELPPLQWRDVDLESSVISITKALESGSNNVKGPKTESGIREVPIPSLLLRRFIDAKKGHSLFEYVFPRPDGRMMDQYYMDNAWRSFKKRVDLALGAETNTHHKIIRSVVADDLTMYCLRHTYCTDLEIAGVPLNVAKYLMGHNDVAVTANIYTHKSHEVIKEAATKIDNLQKRRNA